MKMTWLHIIGVILNIEWAKVCRVVLGVPYWETGWLHREAARCPMYRELPSAKAEAILRPLACRDTAYSFNMSEKEHHEEHDAQSQAEGEPGAA